MRSKRLTRDDARNTTKRKMKTILSDFATFWKRLDRRIKRKSYHYPEYADRYYAEHKRQCIEATNRWRSAHHGYGNKYAYAYQKKHPEVHRKVIKKSKAKRHRDYPTSVFLGKPFEDSVWHHITPDIVVSIPASLHRSIWHSLRSGQGMDTINVRAMAFYEAPRTLK